MGELIPIALGTLAGIPIWSRGNGWSLGVISALAVIGSGGAATLLSGEYAVSWAYVLLDVGEAAFGLAIGFWIAQRLQWRRSSAGVQSRVRGSSKGIPV